MRETERSGDAPVFVGIHTEGETLCAVAVDGLGAVRARASGRTASGAFAALAAESGFPPRAVAFAAVDLDTVRPIVAAAVPPGVPVISIDIGAALVVGEHAYGAARGMPHAVALWVGASVHAGLLLDGRPWLGAHGLAGSAAWLALNPVEREDYRRTGCLQAEIAEGGIVRRLVWRVKAGDRSHAVEAVGGDLGALRADTVFAAARDGDGVAISVVRDTAKYVGMAVANLAATVDPQVVVLGGMLATHADLLLEPVRLELARRLDSRLVAQLAVVPAALGDEAAALGAAHHAMLAARS